MFTLTFVDLVNETSISIWEFREDERSKIILLPTFQLVTRLNSQNRNESKFINELRYINLYMNISISNCHNSSFKSTKMRFLLYFSSLHDY